jgi:hypothetical protein
MMEASAMRAKMTFCRLRHLRFLAVAVLLSATLSAQRYSGHDHAVFHRPAQETQVKRQTSGNGNVVHPKNVPSAAPVAQPTQHQKSALSKPSTELEQIPGSSKMDPQFETSPRL